MSVLEKAIQMAVAAHAGQVCKQGRPYILHPLAVMFAAEKAYVGINNELGNPFWTSTYLGASLEEFMAAAVLHDVPEDHPELYPLSSILTHFGVNVHRIVDGVTRRKEQKEVYKDFIVRANGDKGSRLLKILDIYHNLGRIHTLPLAEQSIRRRYERALDVLNPAEFSLEEAHLGSSHMIRPRENHKQSEVQGSTQ